MKVKFDVAELQKRLGQLGAVIARKAQEPLYQNVKLSVDASGIVSLQGIDIDSTITVKLTAATSDVTGCILLDYKRLNSVVQAMRTKEASISFSDEKSAAAKNDKKWSGLFQGTPTTLFDQLAVVQAINNKPATGGYTLGLPGLKEQIEQVAFSIPAQDGKFVVPSALLESGPESLRVVATDGKMITFSALPTNLGEFAFTLPKTLLELILKLDGGPTVTILDNELFYVVTELETVTYAKTHAEFPPYQKVLPKIDAHTTIAVLQDKEALVSSLQMSLPFCNTEEPGIKFTVHPPENNVQSYIELHAQHTSEQATGDIFTDSAEDSLDAAVTGVATTFKLNIARLLPFLERATFPVTLYASDFRHVVSFHAAGSTPEKPTYSHYLMPMKLE